jgi:glycosyltransferase involved in cell wall biosynthesis
MISIITPSLNCAPFIKACVESVLRQNYDNFEHIIIDGSSQDGTVEILKQYPHLRWISAPDTGEAQALNKALRMVRGNIVGWLNADDYYLEGTFQRVEKEIDPQEGRHVIYGKTNLVNEVGHLVKIADPIRPIKLTALVRWFIYLDVFQPSMFFSKSVIDDVGFFREDLHFSIDYDYWLRICEKGYKFHFVDQVFSCSRFFRQGSKSSAPNYLQARDWHEVSLPVIKQFTLIEQTKFWRDYYLLFRVPNTLYSAIKGVGLPHDINASVVKTLKCIKERISKTYREF